MRANAGWRNTVRRDRSKIAAKIGWAFTDGVPTIQRIGARRLIVIEQVDTAVEDGGAGVSLAQLDRPQNLGTALGPVVGQRIGPLENIVEVRPAKARPVAGQA